MQHAAGIVLYRFRESGLQLFLAHLGGPYFARKDDHGWVVPKGLVEEGETYEVAARREWREETGHPVPVGPLHALPPIKQSGKTNHLFALEGDVDPGECFANTFTIEWPPRSGKRASFPEVDRYAWFGIEEARGKLVKALGLLPELVTDAVSR